MRGCQEASLKFEREVEEEAEEKLNEEEEEKVEEKREDQFLTKKGTSQLQEGYHSF